MTGSTLGRPGSLALPAPVFAFAASLLALMVFAPTSFRAPKMALLAVVLGAVAVKVLGMGVVPIAPHVLYRTMLFVAVGALFVLTGVARRAPGALYMAPVFVIWPMVYVGLIGLVDTRWRLERLVVGLFLLLIAIEAYVITYLAHARSIPFLSRLYVPLDLGQDISSAGIEFNIYSLSSLMFLIPMAIAALFVWPRSVGIFPRWAVWTAAIVGVVLAVLSGRRALMVVILLSPLLATTLRSFLPRDLRRRDQFAGTWIAAAAAGLAVAILFEAVLRVPLAHLVTIATRALEFSTQEDLSRGPQQASLLLAGWRSYPLIGAGLGATLPGLTRSAEQPWAYELSYLALLFQTGVVGVAVYSYGLLWIYRRMRAVVAAGGRLAYLAIPVTTGMTTFLVANASNPYLAKFDALWVLFLPIALINVAYLTGRQKYEGGETVGEPA